MSGVIFHDNDFTEKVKMLFRRVESIAEFVSLLNYIDEKVNNPSDRRKKITVKSLCYINRDRDKWYTVFNIPKKNGKNRLITAPKSYLKYIQSLINILLQIVFYDKVHYNTNGFIINRGIVRNATPHVGKRYLLSVDIKDFFPSIQFRRIKTVLSLGPFYLIGSKEKLAFFIANFCTYKGVLPQGAPTSPILSNIVTQKLDRRISQLCHERKIKYSRYADDLSFSSNQNVFDNDFIAKITKIVIDEGFSINDEKTRIRCSGERQEVTGIVVNRKLNVSKVFLKKVRAILYNWNIKGIDYTQNKFLKHYKPNKGNIKFQEVLWGYISFIGLVRGRNDKLFTDLFYKYLFLKNQIDYSCISNEEVRKRLINDNNKMEELYGKYILSKEDLFIDFCTAAFHQIENLLYYYYWKRFPDICDLSEYLYHNNPEVQKKFKKGIHYYGKIGDIQINNLVYLFEKEFYFDMKIPYNQEITFLRNARNDHSHRCFLTRLDVPQIKKDYNEILEYGKEYFKKNKKNRPLTETEKKTKSDHRFILFMEQHDYNDVRQRLKDVINKIKSYPGIEL